MKKMNSVAKSLLVGALALAITGLAATAQATETPQVITVLKVEGAVRYSMDNKTWQPVHKGDALKQGAILQTAEESSVDIASDEAVHTVLGATPVSASAPNSVANSIGGAGLSALAEGPKPNVIHVFESSTVSFDKLTVETTGVDVVSDTQIDLRAGRILGEVKKLSAASRYEVKIPTGVAGIRGTLYSIAANGTVYCLSGSVIISYVDSSNTPRTVTINAGQSFNPFLNAGVLTTASGAGTVSTLTPAQVAAISSKTPATGTSTVSYTKNNTTVYISPQ